MRNDGREAARTLLWVVVALIVAFGVLGVIMSFAMGTWGYSMGGMMGIGVGWWGLMMVVPALVLVLILLAVLGVFDRSYEPSQGAREVLDLRLARGEISLEEYRRLREEVRR